MRGGGKVALISLHTAGRNETYTAKRGNQDYNKEESNYNHNRTEVKKGRQNTGTRKDTGLLKPDAHSGPTTCIKKHRYVIRESPTRPMKREEKTH